VVLMSGEACFSILTRFIVFPAVTLRVVRARRWAGHRAAKCVAGGGFLFYYGCDPWYLLLLGVRRFATFSGAGAGARKAAGLSDGGHAGLGLRQIWGCWFTRREFFLWRISTRIFGAGGRCRA